MPTSRNQVKYEVNEVTLERATNGWIVTPKYNGLYDSVPSEIAPTIELALASAKGLMTKPFVREDDY